MRYAVMMAALLAACTSDSSAVETLRKQGFTEIETTGYDVFACSEDDTYHTGFRAKNPQGQVVTGTVCCGILKSCTVRW